MSPEKWFLTSFCYVRGKGLCIFFLNKQDGNRDTQFHSELEFIFLLDPIQKLRLPLISVPVDVVLRPQSEASRCTPFNAMLTEEDSLTFICHAAGLTFT